MVINKEDPSYIDIPVLKNELIKVLKVVLEYEFESISL